MEDIKVIPLSGYTQAVQLIDAYLPGNDKTFLHLMYQKYNQLFVGYYLDNALIGICFGYPFKEQRPEETTRMLLQGIAMIHPYNGAGRGGKLLRFFENQVKQQGEWIISLGSADGYVERFYLKNGYIPIALKIEINPSDYVKDYFNHVHCIMDIRKAEDSIGLYIQVDDYDSMDKVKLTQEYHGYGSFFIFEKPVYNT